MDTTAISLRVHLSLLELGILPQYFDVSVNALFSYERRRSDFRIFVTFARSHSPSFERLREIEDILRKELEEQGLAASVDLYVREATHITKKNELLLQSQLDRGWEDTVSLDEDSA